MTAKRVYMVMALDGDAWDGVRWPVCAYLDKETADKHADEAELASRKLSQAMYATNIGDTADLRGAVTEHEKWTNVEAPELNRQHYPYTAPDYYVIEAELREELPK